MDEIIELYSGGGFRLVMSTVSAGPVGPSWDRANPVRKKLLKEIGIISEEVFFVSQHHSKIVVDISEHSFTPITEADGMVSGSKYDSLAVTAADCMPVYLYDRRNGVRALLHSGWKGTGIAANALKLMKEKYETRAEDVVAILGPSIGSCCYNVDEKRAEIFSEKWGRSAIENRNGVNYISLKESNRTMLMNEGVGEIITSDICTCCDSRFGSYRREGPDNFTHMFVLSYLNEAP